MATQENRRAPARVELITLDPGHFHAALIQREHYPNTSPRVHVYAPFGQDLVDHLARLARFNQRADSPTHWQVEVHASDDFLERMLSERPGNVVVISGRNRGKIGKVTRSVGAGLHGLVDKPWILSSSDLGALEQALDLADQKGCILLDIMTERFEVTSVLQRALVADDGVFGAIEPGTIERPSVYMESVHHLMKNVAGVPNLRPAWFFDPAQQGEGLTDIGAHLVDLAQWTLFPEQSLDHRRDIELLAAQRWPTIVPMTDFQRVTGETALPAFLERQRRGQALECFMNTFVTYKLRGIHVALSVIWDWEAPAGGADRHFAVYRGKKARVEVRQGRAQGYRTELFVVPNEGKALPDVQAALARRLNVLAATYPGLALDARGGELHVSIPDQHRTSHERHFAQVANRFLDFIQNPASLPRWEKPNMLAKYWLTTHGTELAQRSAAKMAPRLAPA